MNKIFCFTLFIMIFSSTLPAFSSQELHPPRENSPVAITSPAVEMKMKHMQVVRAQMMEAKTPEKMKQLMHQHMEEMKGGMKMMMGMMRGGMMPMGGKDMAKMDMEEKMDIMEKKMSMMLEMMSSMLAQQEMTMKK